MRLYDRPVEVTEIDFEFNEYCYAISANFTDNGVELTEIELERLNELYADELYQNAYENAASNAYDRAKDFRKYGEW